jgi:hypothetical protein
VRPAEAQFISAIRKESGLAIAAAARPAYTSAALGVKKRP